MLEKIKLITEILELAIKFKKELLYVLLFFLTSIILILNCGKNINDKNKILLNQQWADLSIGDSIFIKKNVFYLSFYKKGRKKLDLYDQKKIKYRREDTLSFTSVNSVHEKYFYKNRNSFIGICLGKDSTITKQGKYKGNRWVIIKPSYKITHPQKSNKYEFDKRKWKIINTSYNFNGKLSKEYFVRFSDIQNLNNDSIFR